MLQDGGKWKMLPPSLVAICTDDNPTPHCVPGYRSGE